MYSKYEMYTVCMVHYVDGEGDMRRTYSTSQDAKRSLMDIHDGVVFPFVTIHFLKNMNKM